MKKDIIDIPRYCDARKPHRLIQVKDNIYRFEPAEDWMPIYITKNHDEDITAIDCDCMGEALYIGRKVGDKVIDGFIFDKAFLVRFK